MRATPRWAVGLTLALLIIPGGSPPSAVQKKISAPSRRRPRLTKGAINTGEQWLGVSRIGALRPLIVP
jgi:hypothetical protein